MEFYSYKGIAEGKYVEGDIGRPCPKIIFTLPPSNSNQSFPPKTHICPR